MKRLAALVMLAFGALQVPAFALPPVGNDHVLVTASFSCASDGSQTITWTIEQFAKLGPAFITSWATTPDASTPLLTTLPPQGSTTATANVTSGTTTEHADITATWTSHRVDTQSIDVTVPPCIPTTTTAAATTTTENTIGPQGSTSTSAAQTTTTGGSLPFTGSSGSGALLALGVALAGCGGVLLGVTRKRRRALTTTRASNRTPDLAVESHRLLTMTA